MVTPLFHRESTITGFRIILATVQPQALRKCLADDDRCQEENILNGLVTAPAFAPLTGWLQQSPLRSRTLPPPTVSPLPLPPPRIWRLSLIPPDEEDDDEDRCPAQFPLRNIISPTAISAAVGVTRRPFAPNCRPRHHHFPAHLLHSCPPPLRHLSLPQVVFHGRIQISFWRISRIGVA